MRPQRLARLSTLAVAFCLAGLVAGCGSAVSPTSSGQVSDPTAAAPTATPAGHSAKPRPAKRSTSKPAAAHKAGPALRVVFVDVGQGDAMIVQNGSWAGMIDGGPQGSAGAIEAALGRLGIRRLNAVVITHPHVDHTGGLQQVILDEHPKTAYVGEGPGRDADELRDVGAKLVRVRTGMSLAFGTLRARVLSPASLDGDPNQDSVVLLLDAAGKRLLFTGDCTGPDEAAVGAILARGPPLFLLKVAHHGSRFSSTATFLAETDPRYAVICVGHNSYGHPTPETVQRLRHTGATIYSTQKNGTITLTIAASGAASWAFAASSQAVTRGAASGSSASGTSRAGGGSASGGTLVYVTATGECYHVKGCRYLAKSCIPMTLKQAKADGYRPCSVCKPPG